MNGVVRPLLFEIMSYVPTVIYVMEIVSKAVQAKITQDSSWIQTFLEQNYDQECRKMSFQQCKQLLSNCLTQPEYLYNFVDHNKVVSVYNIRTKEIKNTTLPIDYNFSGAAAWVCWKNGVLYSGGRDNSITFGNGYTVRTLFFDPSDMSLTRYADMKKERGGHAMIQYRQEIYMFGGFDNQDITHCEKYTNDEWSWLPHMQVAKTKLGVAEIKGKMYLAGWPSPQVEVFDPLNSTFWLLDWVTFPNTNQGILFSYNGLLYILTCLNQYIIDVEKETCQTLNINDGPHRSIGNWAMMPPIVYDDKVYFVNWGNQDNRLSVFNLSKNLLHTSDANAMQYYEYFDTQTERTHDQDVVFEEKVAQIAEMGFEDFQIREALHMHGNDVEQALNSLLSD